MGLFLGWMCYYNFAQTGHPFLAAYQLWREQQGVVPAFWWQPLRRAEPVYYSLQAWQFHSVWEVGIYNALHKSVFAGLLAMALRIVSFFRMNLRALLILPFLVGISGLRHMGQVADEFSEAAGPRYDWVWFASAPVMMLLGNSPVGSILFLVWSAAWLIYWRKRGGQAGRRIGILIAMLAAGAAVLMTTNFSMPSYYSHFVAPAFVLVALGLKDLSAWRRSAGVGRAMVANIAASCGLMFLVCCGLALFHVHVLHEFPFHWAGYENRLADRTKTEAFLKRQPGKQLAIVRYGPNHDVLLEWVWNGADIDDQKIVWARELKPDWTAQLVRYYQGRSVWLVEPDSGVIRPYPVTALPTATTPLPQLAYRK
jgi:hypothetical protein